MRRLLIALAFCLLASPVLAQVSPDGTEGPTVTSAEGVFTLDTGNQLFLNGVQIGGFGSKYFVCGSVYVLGIDGNWWKRQVGASWDSPGPKPTTCTAPVTPIAPVFVTPVPGGTYEEGPATIIASHSGTNTTGYRLYLNGAQAQEQPVSALVNGEIRFGVVLFANTSPIFAVTAYNAAGETAAVPVQITVTARPVSWRCSLPSAVTAYANGDKKVTLRCGPTFSPIKGSTVTVTK